MEFKVGDRVKCKEKFADKYLKDCTGTVCDIKSYSTMIGVEYDNSFDEGHNCNDTCERGHGRYGYPNEIEHISSASLPTDIMTTKKVMHVLVVNKKTGSIEKDVTVIADNEQHAILKAFNVNADKVFIKVTEQGSYEEEKPLTVIQEKK